MAKNDDRIVPLPAVFKRPSDPAGVRRRTWTFTESEMGTTDLHKRHMTLPMGDSDDAFSVRCHEMLHAALTPHDIEDGQGDSRFLASEDGRIETIARNRGVTRPKGKISADLVASLLAKGDVAGALECSVACLGSPNEDDQRASLAAMGTPEANEILALMDWAASVYAADETVQSAYDVADRLRQILGEAPKPPAAPKPSPKDDSQAEDEPEDDSQDEPGQGEDDPEPEPEDEPEGDSEGQGEDEPEPEDDSQGNGQGEDEPEDDSEGDSEPEDEPEDEPEGDSEGSQGQGEDDSEPASHLEAMARENKSAGQGGEGPMIHGVKIERQSVVAKAKGGDGTVKAPKRDRNAQEGRPKSVVPVDFDAMAEWMPMLNSDSVTAKCRPEDGNGQWGRVEIEYPARPNILVQKQRGHKASKATDYGSVPSRMHRLPVDSKVFKSKRHTRQGTVLIDCSGSMDLSKEEIQELIEYAPAAVIAGYAGTGSHGRIRILAADGKMVEEDQLDLKYGSNVIDGPAIAWLAQQRGPRVMVTDGLMVSANPGAAIHVLRIEGDEEQQELMDVYKNWRDDTSLAKQATRIAAKARVTIVKNPADAKKHLR